MSNALLELLHVETCYGSCQVLFDVNLTIAPGEMVTLMGRNGMGKTTTVRSIMGLTPCMSGSIRFAGPVRRVGLVNSVDARSSTLDLAIVTSLSFVDGLLGSRPCRAFCRS